MSGASFHDYPPVRETPRYPLPAMNAVQSVWMRTCLITGAVVAPKEKHLTTDQPRVAQGTRGRQRDSSWRPRWMVRGRHMLCSVAVLFHKVRAGQMDRLDR